jgi:ABC-type sugar transport system ATPase subunit
VSGAAGLPGVRTALGWHELRDAEHIAAGWFLPTGKSSAGEVTVLIRPEQISLCAPGASASVTGKVTETRYHGHDAIVVVDVAEAGVLQVRSLGADLPAPGEEVALVVGGPVTAWSVRPAGAAGASGPVDGHNPKR